MASKVQDALAVPMGELFTSIKRRDAGDRELPDEGPSPPPRPSKVSHLAGSLRRNVQRVSHHHGVPAANTSTLAPKDPLEVADELASEKSGSSITSENSKMGEESDSTSLGDGAASFDLLSSMLPGSSFDSSPRISFSDTPSKAVQLAASNLPTLEEDKSHLHGAASFLKNAKKGQRSEIEMDPAEPSVTGLNEAGLRERRSTGSSGNSISMLRKRSSVAATWEYDEVTGDGGVALNFDAIMGTSNLARLNDMLEHEAEDERKEEKVHEQEEEEVYAKVTAAAARMGLTIDDAMSLEKMPTGSDLYLPRPSSASRARMLAPKPPTFLDGPLTRHLKLSRSLTDRSKIPKLPMLTQQPQTAKLPPLAHVNLGWAGDEEASPSASTLAGTDMPAPRASTRPQPARVSPKADMMRSKKEDLAQAIRDQLKAQMKSPRSSAGERPMREGGRDGISPEGAAQEILETCKNGRQDAGASATTSTAARESLNKTIKVDFIDGKIKPLNIVMLVTGTRGDVQPFIGIGLKLQEYGHRVRLASHKIYREFVEGFGLEFYPLGGDPKVLSEYVVKHRGIMPGLNLNDALKQRDQVREILYSSWGACIEPDPNNMDKTFIADAIVANPPAYGHSHCAEKLNCPLHIVFTMPWSPTKAFPSPFARIKTVISETNSTAREVMNWLSYFAMEDLAWLGMSGMVKDFRKRVLGLKTWSKEHMSHALYHSKVPMTYIWSPSLVGRPKDWPTHCEVVGFINLEVNKLTNYTPPQDLADFLAAGPPPVYIGFGSLVVSNPAKMTQQFLDAVAATGLRAIIQKGWGGLGAGVDTAPENVFLLEGNCAHDWLFQQCSAVVHHGGAGTTATGLYAGKPTFIVYFFGDQPFWGAACHSAGVGPEPIGIDDLTTPKIIEALKELILPSKQKGAERMSELMHREDGVSMTVDHLHRTIYGSLMGGRSHMWMRSEASHKKHVHPSTDIIESDDREGSEGHLRGQLKIPRSRTGTTTTSSGSSRERGGSILAKISFRSGGGAKPSPPTVDAGRSWSCSGSSQSSDLQRDNSTPQPPIVEQGPMGPRKGRFFSFIGC